MNAHIAAASMLLGAALFAEGANARESCSTVSIAELNWTSAGLAAWVDRLILEKGFGCSVSMVSGDTDSTMDAIIATGEPDIIPEFWFESATPALDEAVADKRIAFAAPLLNEGGVQGWWIPKFIVDAHPEVTTVQQALSHPELFIAAEGGERPAVFSCPEGWACRVSTENLFRALGAADKGFDLVEAQSGSALDASVARAFADQQGWLGYYWAPTALLGEYDMVKLSFGVEFSKQEWDSCTIVADCADPKLNAYPVSAVYTLVDGEFVTEYPELMDYFNNRSWSNGTVSEVLAWMSANDAGNEAGARHFLSTYPDVWKAWLADDVAERVAGAL
ncbi:glycine betaine ABC transporter substrate-binding protein [Martelella radicis]|uniref:Glycine betaine/proline transport system substrate-binding protein n=1 Tax=Martelella radicis TaxID=1397476 RepID=A0A7W6KIT3_9HYPH|nr:glycine betaine ABC transporter substrate-binding protein [Martelella radicis]MBB4121785.1 glycine betaine/proline transport system substrate-binding protein [Martelella radicis]